MKLIDERQVGFLFVGCNLMVVIIIPLSMLPLVLAAVLGPTAYELYYLGYATSKNCLQIEIITGKRKRYATVRVGCRCGKTNWVNPDGFTGFCV